MKKYATRTNSLFYRFSHGKSIISSLLNSFNFLFEKCPHYKVLCTTLRGVYNFPKTVIVEIECRQNGVFDGFLHMSKIYELQKCQNFKKTIYPIYVCGWVGDHIMAILATIAFFTVTASRMIVTFGKSCQPRCRKWQRMRVHSN